MLLESVRDQYRTSQRLTAAALLVTRRARSSSPDRLPALLGAFQVAAVQNVTDHTGPVLEEQGIRDDAVAAVNVASLVGVASDGRDLGSLVTLPGLTDDAFDRIVTTQLADVARHAAAIERAVRPSVTHYVRAVNLPACGRCIVLAGKPQRSQVAFDRHPRCDCVGVPSTGGKAERQVTDPARAFAAMTQAEREKAFTRAGAEAIGLGADPAQVVNARRGMDTAQGVAVTREGVHVSKYGRVRGVAGQRMRSAGLAGPRLMPESILALSSTPDEARRLLSVYGYTK